MNKMNLRYDGKVIKKKIHDKIWLNLFFLFFVHCVWKGFDLCAQGLHKMSQAGLPTYPREKYKTDVLHRVGAIFYRVCLIFLFMIYSMSLSSYLKTFFLDWLLRQFDSACESAKQTVGALNFLICLNKRLKKVLNTMQG